MTFKKTDLEALNWLKKEGGYKTSEIIYSSNKTPSFICNDGKRYEARYLYNDLIIFSEEQQEKLKSDDIILLFKDGKNKGKFKWEHRDNIVWRIKTTKNKKAYINMKKSTAEKLQKIAKKRNEDINDTLNYLIGLIPSIKPRIGNLKGDLERFNELKMKLGSGIKGKEYNKVLEEYQELANKYKNFVWKCNQCGNKWRKLEYPTRCPKCKKDNWNKPAVQDLEREAKERRW